MSTASPTILRNNTETIAMDSLFLCTYTHVQRVAVNQSIKVQDKNNELLDGNDSKLLSWSLINVIIHVSHFYWQIKDL